MDPLSASWFWPKVADRKNAQFAIDEGFWVLCFVSAITAIFAGLAVAGSPALGVDAWGFVDAAVFGAIAFGVRRRSRTAAILGLVLYVSERVYVWATLGPRNLVLPAVVILALLHGVRGTFAYHRFPALPVGLPSIEQSFQAVKQGPPEGGQDGGQH